MRELIYLILSLVAVPVFAQEEQWVRSSSLGFKGGINFANLSIRGDGEYNPTQRPYAGFVYTDYVYDFLAAKFELTYSGQGGKYEYAEKNIDAVYSIPYLSLGYVMSFRFLSATRLDCGGSLDFVLSKDRHIPDQQMIDLTGFMGLELPITEQLSLEGRIKGGFWSVTKANTNEYPFRYDPKNVVYQVGIVYYFNTDVWRDK